MNYDWEGRYHRLAQAVAGIALNENWDKLTKNDFCYGFKKTATDIIRERNRELYTKLCEGGLMGMQCEFTVGPRSATLTENEVIAIVSAVVFAHEELYAELLPTALATAAAKLRLLLEGKEDK